MCRGQACGRWWCPEPGARLRAGWATVCVTEAPLPSDINISNTDIYKHPQRCADGILVITLN